MSKLTIVMIACINGWPQTWRNEEDDSITSLTHLHISSWCVLQGLIILKTQKKTKPFFSNHVVTSVKMGIVISLFFFFFF